jgi:hypothetical protein
MNDLPVEKQLTHTIFCNQIQNIDLDSAKQLLTELHMLYLGQQAVMIKIAKQEFLGINTTIVRTETDDI